MSLINIFLWKYIASNNPGFIPSSSSFTATTFFFESASFIHLEELKFWVILLRLSIELLDLTLPCPFTLPFTLALSSKLSISMPRFCLSQFSPSAVIFVRTDLLKTLFLIVYVLGLRLTRVLDKLFGTMSLMGFLPSFSLLVTSIKRFTSFFVWISLCGTSFT
jgi:hypothetical protein